MPRPLQYLENISADSTEPIRFPKWGTLLTYGRALVMRIFRFPGSGRIILGFCESSAIFEDVLTKGSDWELYCCNGVLTPVGKKSSRRFKFIKELGGGGCLREASQNQATDAQ